MCQERINKKAVLISLMAPTFFLTFIALIIAYIFRIDLLGILAIFNLSGATGDILMTLFILRLPDDIKYIDYDNVIGFYLLSKKDYIIDIGFKKINVLVFKESGKDSDKLINKDIKTLTISKPSWIILGAFIIITIIFYILQTLI